MAPGAPFGPDSPACRHCRIRCSRGDRTAPPVATTTYRWSGPRPFCPRIAPDVLTRRPGRCAATSSWDRSPGLARDGGWMSRSIRRVLCSGAVTGLRVAVIHLARPLLTGSSALPACSGGPPSNACCLSLLQVGFTEPPQSPGALVVSYTTVSPLPRAPADRGRRIHGAVCSLWHCPADHSGWLLATTLPCGARTFLGS